MRHDPDEFSTDLGKNVAELSRFETAQRCGELQLVIVGGLSGRLDQTIHTLHALIQLVEKQGRDRVWAIGQESAACILPKVNSLLFPRFPHGFDAPISMWEIHL